MAVFVGGKGLSLFLSAFSLTLPLYVSKLPLLFLCSRPLSSSPSLSVTPATSLFWVNEFAVNSSLIFSLVHVYFSHSSLPLLFLFLFLSHSHPPLPPLYALFSLIYLFITASHVLFLYSLTLLLHDPSFSLPTIMSTSLLPPSQLLPLSR